jgi:hypothetical protein
MVAISTQQFNNSPSNEDSNIENYEMHSTFASNVANSSATSATLGFLTHHVGGDHGDSDGESVVVQDFVSESKGEPDRVCETQGGE